MDFIDIPAVSKDEAIRAFAIEKAIQADAHPASVPLAASKIEKFIKTGEVD